MNDREAPTPPGGESARVRATPKGRRVDPGARDDVRALLADDPPRRDLLIEYLHRIQDSYGHLSAAHLAALADEMKLALTEVYEVATFYHHFDVVKEGEAPPPPITVRVCDSISCEIAGATELLNTLPGLLGREVRVLHAPCIGRCETAPAAVVGQNPLPHATVENISALVQANAVKHPGAGVKHPHLDIVSPDYIDYVAYRRAGGYAVARACIEGDRRREDVIAAMESSGLRGPGRRGLPRGTQVEVGGGGARPAPVRHQHRRGRARNVQRPLVPRTRSPPLRRGGAHCRLGGRDRRDLRLSARRVPRLPRDSRKGARGAQADPPCTLPPIHLRRGAGAYICGEESALIESIEGKRGMPRLRPPYVAQVGLFDRPTLEHNMETLHWVRDILERGAEWFSSQGRNGRKGLRSFSVSGRVKKPGVHLAPAGITVKELIAEYCGGMLEGHRFYAYLPGGASGGILPATMGDIPLDFDTLNQYGCFIGSAAIVILSDRDRAAAAARNLMQVLLRGILRPVHALPRGNGEGAEAHGEGEVGPAAAEGAFAGDDGRIHMRAGTGGSQPGALCDDILPSRGRLMARGTRWTA